MNFNFHSFSDLLRAQEQPHILRTETTTRVFRWIGAGILSEPSFFQSEEKRKFVTEISILQKALKNIFLPIKMQNGFCN